MTLADLTDAEITTRCRVKGDSERTILWLLERREHADISEYLTTHLGLDDADPVH